MAGYLIPTYYYPSYDVYADPGSQVSLVLTVQAKGEDINAYYRILVDGSPCAEKFNDQIAKEGQRTINCKITMPVTQVTVTYVGGHASGGQWVEDFKKTIKVSPPPTGYLIPTYYYPSSQIYAESGATVSPVLTVQAVDNPLNGYVRILRGSSVCKEEANIPMQEGDQKTINCNFVMPSSEQTLTFEGYHSAGGSWVKDFTKTVKVALPPSKETRVTAYDASCTLGEVVELSAKLEYYDLWWRNMDGEELLFYVDGKYYSTPVTVNGIAKVNYAPQRTGSLNVEVKYLGKIGYVQSSDTATLTVSAAPLKETRVTVYNASCTLGEVVELSAKLEYYDLWWRNMDNEDVFFYIGGQYYATPVTVNGIAKVNYAPQRTGSLSIEVRYLGKAGYASSNDTGTLTVGASPLKETRVTAYDASCTLGEVVELSAKLEYYDLWWRNMDGEELLFYVDGKYYSTPVTVNGIAKVNYAPQRTGSLNVEVKYLGKIGYNTSTDVATLMVEEQPLQGTKMEFSIKDENNIETTTLEVGKQYALRLYLKTSDNNPIQNAQVWIRTPEEIINHGLTNESGYYGVFWSPTKPGSFIINAEFYGTEIFSPCSKSKQITIKDTLAWHNYNAVWHLGYGFNKVVGYLEPLLNELINKISSMGLSDLILIRNISSNTSNQTITVNFDTPTQSEVSEDVKTGLMLAMAAALLAISVVNPILGVVIAAILVVIKLIAIVTTDPTEPDQSGFIEALRWPDGAKLGNITFELSDGKLTQNVTTDASTGIATVTLKESDLLSIITAYDNENEYAPGKTDRDPYWNERPVVAQATTTIWFHFAEFAEPFEIPVVIKGGDHDGEPAVGAYVVLSNPYNEDAGYWSAVTDENGLAKFGGGDKGWIERTLWTATAMAAKESESQYDQKVLDLTQTPYSIPTLEIAHQYTITRLKTISGTNIPLPGATATLINEQTLEVVDTKETTSKGLVTFYIIPTPGTTYRLEQEKAGFNNDLPLIEDNIPGDQPSQGRDEMEQTGEICDVTVIPINEETKVAIPSAKITLHGQSTFGPKPYGEQFLDVPYGDYTIEIEAENFIQTEEQRNLVWTVGPVCKIGGYCNCIFKPEMSNALGPGKIMVECIVQDEYKNRVPNAFIKIEFITALLWHGYEIDTNDVLIGDAVNTTNGICVQCTDEGACKFVLAPIGTQIGLFEVDKYRIKAGHEDYYNEKGKKGEWSETVELVETPATPILFTLTTKPEVGYTKLLLSVAATAGLLVGGTLAKKSKNPAISKIAPVIKYSAIVPGVVAVYEGGKIVIKKVEDIIPW